ncbi:MAG TPA: LysR family transcriptional regulator [Thermoanaerobaculia bacterium]|nr:LysR family transcriptional regulator [Thermoanaerobaculia bacterium]
MSEPDAAGKPGDDPSPLGGGEMLNHHHLYHFWTIVREGGVTRASERLHVSQPTVSGQVRELEHVLGEKLLARSGRTVVLTEIGRTVYRYTDQMISLEREMVDVVKGRRPMSSGKLAVGLAMVVPKLIAYQMLKPALELSEALELVCMHERPERLLAELAIFGLDVVLADAPAPASVKVRCYSHVLGECSVSIFGNGRLAATYREGFPQSLDGAPFLMPSADSALSLSLEAWCQKKRIRPRIVGTFEDSALLDAFGQAGAGLFAMPTAIETELRRQYQVELLGTLHSVRQRFYAITVDRKIRNPYVIAISERARTLFA